MNFIIIIAENIYLRISLIFTDAISEQKMASARSVALPGSMNIPHQTSRIRWVYDLTFYHMVFYVISNIDFYL